MTLPVLNNDKRPQPVVTPQVISAAITLVIGWAVAFGLIPQATSSKVLSALPIIVGAVFAVIAAMHSIVAIFASRRVTPSSDPQAVVVRADGTKVMEPLVPLSLAVQSQPNHTGVEDPFDDFADLRTAAAAGIGEGG